jgi:hypothetical protein
MYYELKELLFSPDAFFTKKAKEKIDLLLPAIIVLIGSMVGLVASFIVSDFLNIIELRHISVLLTPENFLVILLKPFIAWFLLTGIFYGLCRLWSGKGTFIATLQNTGYGALPLTILTLVPILDGIFTNLNMNIPPMLGYGVGIILDLLTVLFILWSGYLWVYAMERTHKIEHEKAIASAVIVVLLYLGYHLIHTLGIVNLLPS